MAKAPSTSTRKSTATRSKTTTTTKKTTSGRSTTKASMVGKTASSGASVSAPLPKTTTRPVAGAAEKDATPDTSVVSELPDMRKRELVDAVVDRSGIKKRYAKPAIEAALAILGEVLEEGRSLQMPPLGRVKVQRTKALADGQVIVAKLRRKHVSEAAEDDAKSDDEALAKAAE